MQKNMKRRLAVVSGVIVIVVIAVLAIVAGGTAAKSLTVAEAATGEHSGQKVQVAGNVVTDSFTIEVGKVVFSIYDPD
ncbi:MAG: cytochrome c maturation protein CcmE, partial [Eggerthellaceae bacterium]|nr:cytochrome c maturation protein CcmE [Eggerthellaceae bacterium]